MPSFKLPKSIVRSLVCAVLVMLFVLGIAIWMNWSAEQHLWITLGSGIVAYVVTLFFMDFYKKK